MNLFTAADLHDWQAAMQRAAWAPKGTKRQRERELRRLTAEMLERETQRDGGDDGL